MTTENTNTQMNALEAALALVDFGPCRGAKRPQDWVNVASPMCEHCIGEEDVNLAAARIIAESRMEMMEMMEMIQRCEMWLSTIPEGRKMQLECHRVLASNVSSIAPDDKTPTKKTTL
jgi:hypothetical protein